MSSINVSLMGVFAVIVVLFIWGGMTYNKKLDERARDEVVAAQEQIKTERQKLMEKLVKEDITIGKGAEAKTGSVVSVHYLGTLADGTKFDSSYDRGQSFEFTLGRGEVIEGWDLGVLGMKVGGKRKLTIPAELGYGESGYGPIPGGATLLFTVELIGVK